MSEIKKIKKVLVIGSGPIVIGQAAEFDYAGTQACKSLREEGIKVVLVNSNPATIQTDKEIADRVYIEPLKADVLETIIEKEKPEGILATVGGQTGLNLAMELHRKGVLKKYSVKFLGTDADAIERAEDRNLFNETMSALGVPILPGKTVRKKEEAFEFAHCIGYPVIIRPSFTLGGTGSGMARNDAELDEIASNAFRMSAIHEALVEKSVLGWAEFEYEAIRDKDGNKIIVCNMENIDPMGIHTGESIVVAPSQTLSDSEHQMLRNTALKIVERIGIEGSCNVQFAVNRKTGEFAVIEVNPRLSRSSALASKATGYPIARVAAKIAIGKKLHEIKNAITGTSAAFEPSLDYVVTKIPRWPFDKFPLANRIIGTQMKSTGEVMAIGRTFEESVQKAIRGLDFRIPSKIEFEKHLNPPTDLRIFAILEAFRNGVSIDDVEVKTKINRWFLDKMKNIVKMEKNISSGQITAGLLLKAKKMGFSDAQIARIKNMNEKEVRKIRKNYNILPSYKMVDSCAGEFEALTPYYYSTYESENEAKPISGKSAIIIGSGPIRIGQGIEFDYCCSHAAFALRGMKIKSIMINNNPETVSTDFDSSDRLYVEPLTFEDVLNIVENESASGELLGVIVQLGGQTSINIASQLADYGVKILGTPIEGIDMAEDRERFRKLLENLSLLQPPNGSATNEKEALEIAGRIGYPVVVRPSYVIAGRAMEIVYDDESLKYYIQEAVEVSERRPVLIDKYLDNAYECEVDAVSDWDDIFISGIMEHIEFAGVHSGDANIVLPSIHLDEKTKKTIEEYTKKISRALNIVGFINIQYAVKNNSVFVLEANPRASRTVPFVSKATSLPLTRIAVELMLGRKLKNLKINGKQKNIAVKSIAFPFLKLTGSDVQLGPEMRSTGETMGLGSSFEMAYYKALLAAGVEMKANGTALLSLRDEDKHYAAGLAALLKKLNTKICGTHGTIKNIEGAESVPKIGKGSPNVLDRVNSGEISIVINTPTKGGRAHTDGFKIRRSCLEKGIPCIINVQTAFEFLKAAIELKNKKLEIKELGEYCP